jgi:4-carboxymuconolactone decarboxylase
MEDLLRRLALNDEQAVAAVMVPGAQLPSQPAELDAKTDALVRLGAVLASSGTPASCRLAVEHARDACASDAEIIGVLVAVGPAIGLARLVTVAQRLALAIDVELDDRTEGEAGVW